MQTIESIQCFVATIW